MRLKKSPSLRALAHTHTCVHTHTHTHTHTCAHTHTLLMAITQSLQCLSADAATDLHIILHSGSWDPASMGSPQLVPGLGFLVGCLEKAYRYNSTFPVTFSLD